MRAKIRGTGSNFPGQEASLWGQLSQVPRWGSHSARHAVARAEREWRSCFQVE